MPISADPTKTTEYWLACDADKLEKERPVLICRFLTRKQTQQHAELLAKAAQFGGGDEGWGCIYDAIKIGVVGWRNQVTPDGASAPAFDAEKISELFHSVFTDEEIQEIALEYPSRVRLAEKDLFFSGSRLPSGAGQSAKPAQENAPIVPATEPKTQAA